MGWGIAPCASAWDDTENDSTRPPAPAVTRNSRREAPIDCAVMALGLRLLAGRPLDGGADPRVGRATADVARHGGVDVGVGGLGLLGQQRRGRHDLARLAVAAL